MSFSKKNSTKPVLTNALMVSLPTEEQTWFLRACLWSGLPGRQSWSTWRHQVGDPVSFFKEEKAGFKGLLPLLFDSLRLNEITPEKTFQTYLRTSYLRAEIRSRLYRTICRDVLSTFTRMGIVTAVLKGAALAETVYRKPELQHSHYLDILIENEYLLPASSFLPSLGFEPLNAEISSKCERIEVRHESKLPLILQSCLFETPFYNVDMEDIWARSKTSVIADVPTHLLSCADNLIHICGSALYSVPQESLRWVCDAWFLIDRCRDLDWDVLLNCARCRRLALPLSVTLSYLKEKLSAPIDKKILDSLYAIASQTDTLGRETALFGLRTSTGNGFKRLLQSTTDWHERAVII
jgi:hypothetical protein